MEWINKTLKAKHLGKGSRTVVGVLFAVPSLIHMKSHMFGLRHYFQIFRGVVLSIMVFVVNNLAFRQKTPKRFFSYQDMFKNITASTRSWMIFSKDTHVSVWANISPIAKVKVSDCLIVPIPTFKATKFPAMLVWIERLLTAEADNFRFIPSGQIRAYFRTKVTRPVRRWSWFEHLFTIIAALRIMRKKASEFRTAFDRAKAVFSFGVLSPLENVATAFANMRIEGYVASHKYKASIA